MNREELYKDYRKATIEKGASPIGKSRFFGIIQTLIEINEFPVSQLSNPKEDKEEKCPCCSGKGVVEGEFCDDLYPCNTCFGSGEYY